MASIVVNSLKDLKEIGRKLLSSRREINALPRLLQYISPNHPPQYVLESLLSLQAFFIPILPQLPSSISSSKRRRLKDSENKLELEFSLWARERYDEFIEALIEVLVSPQSEDTLKDVVLDAVMEFVKIGNGGGFHSSIYHKLIQRIVNSTNEVDVLLGLLASNYFKYIDVRYFTYISLDKLAKTLEGQDTPGNNEDHSIARVESSIRKIHHILSHIPPSETQNEKSDIEMWSGSGFSTKEGGHVENSKEDKGLKTEKRSKNVLSAASIAKKMKLKFTKAWISFLRLPLPLDVYKEVLVALHQAVIPYISNPIMLCDFLTRSYDIGGVVSVMALSSLYILMTQHGLEYPNFYDKLYALLVPSIFMAKHRAKFFELLDSCLKSPILPAYLAAAFAKKLSRLSLLVPPSGSLVIVVLIHNLLRRHPAINCLVHRENGDETASDDLEGDKKISDCAEELKATTKESSRKRGIDYFNNEEINPLKCNAMKSSLWEIDTLRHHYCPPVSRFVLSLENDLTVRAKTTEMNVKDFSSGSYATIFGEEIRRRVKQVPLAFYKAAPASLFSEIDFPGWTFKYDDKEENTAEEHGSKTEEHNLSSGKRQRIECA